jgi:hypothetical protein
MSKVVNANVSDSIAIAGGAFLSQLPASLILAADTVFEEMCRRGQTSPEFQLSIKQQGDGPKCWFCHFGGFTSTGYTPWAAVLHMAEQLQWVNDQVGV